jgi:hypothetical protein
MIVNPHPVSNAALSDPIKRDRGVVEIVAVKALKIYSEPQLLRAWPQRVRSKSLIFTRFQQTSTSREIWFGTTVSTH